MEGPDRHGHKPGPAVDIGGPGMRVQGCSCGFQFFGGAGGGGGGAACIVGRYADVQLSDFGILEFWSQAAWGTEEASV